MNKGFVMSLVTVCLLYAIVFPSLAVENTAIYEVGVSPQAGGLSSSIGLGSGFALSTNSGAVVSMTPDLGAAVSVAGSKYANDQKFDIDLGFTLISPAYDYNGVKVAEGSVQLCDGSWATIGHDSYVDDGYLRLLREQTDTSGVQWYIIACTGTQIGNYRSLDGSSFTEVWLKKSDCVSANTISLNTANSLRQNIVRTALSLLGKGYAYGSTGPDSFDCSGFVNYVMSQNGISVPRTSTQICHMAGNEIQDGVSGLRPGDIVGRSGHVGIYIGDGYFVHASEENTGVKVDTVWEYNQVTPFTNYRNVVGD